MRIDLSILLPLSLMLFACHTSPEDRNPFPEVGMDGDWLTVGGEKFLVVGVGYEIGCRPGRTPWERDFRPDLLRADFERIRAAGFNTIRTWGPSSDEELALAAEYGLWVTQGIWFDPGADFSDSTFQRETLQLVEKVVTQSAKHPNILLYLIGNEPHADSVYRTGVDDVNAFFRKLVETARRCDPKRLFSYSNCVMTDFMVPDMWDLTAQNVYPYSPVTIEKTLGYRGYLETIKRRLALDKPLVITEFGLSVSPDGDGRGYGGNTLEEQSNGVVALWDDILTAGCAGGCAFMWIDGWWKNGEEKAHNGHAEEWYGLLEADTEFSGVPRPVYYALQEYNRAIRTEPSDGGVYSDQIPVEVWAPHAQGVEARVDDQSWMPLTKTGSWWRGRIRTVDLTEGIHRVSTRLGDRGSEKTAVVEVRRDGIAGDFLAVTFQNLPGNWPFNRPLAVTISVKDINDIPVSDRVVSVSRFCHTSWNEWSADVTTDANGLTSITLPAMSTEGIISIAASVDGTLPARNGDGWKQVSVRRYGDYRHVELIKSADF
ncbi:MAG: hypothetical protein KJ626_12050 [Verrucomicrobia bacterium]|nr:hypothetical protein [Verrucomicrobiota bacterium]